MMTWPSGTFATPLTTFSTTPPVGIVLNVVSGVAKVPLGQVIGGVWPFLLAQTAVLFLLVLFPELVLVPLHWLR